MFKDLPIDWEKNKEDFDYKQIDNSVEIDKLEKYYKNLNEKMRTEIDNNISSEKDKLEYKKNPQIKIDSSHQKIINSEDKIRSKLASKSWADWHERNPINK